MRKPRLIRRRQRLRNGRFDGYVWVCSARMCYGHGRSAQAAYAEWLREWKQRVGTVRDLFGLDLEATERLYRVK